MKMRLIGVAFDQPTRVGANFDAGAGIEGRVAQRMRVSEKRFDAQDVLVRSALCQASGDDAQSVADVFHCGLAHAGV